MTEKQDELLLRDEEFTRWIQAHQDGVRRSPALCNRLAQLAKAKQHYELEKAFAFEDGFDKGIGHERKYGQKRLDRPDREKIARIIYGGSFGMLDDKIHDVCLTKSDQILALIQTDAISYTKGVLDGRKQEGEKIDNLFQAFVSHLPVLSKGIYTLSIDNAMGFRQALKEGKEVGNAKNLD